ncbi:MAG TPA: site-specific integrase [Rectinema sp.]|nr:site-specific integrase [Rectinema sp.]HRU77518.1 site-specific integrase [Rectinema sp.]
MGVKIRQKGDHLYLDLYEHGRRRWEALGMTVPKEPAARRDVMALAEAVRQKREMQLVAGRYQLLDPVKAKMKLTDYAKQIAAPYKKTAHLPKSLKYLEPFAKDTRLQDVDETFLEGYKAYLLTLDGIGATTAKHYFDALKAVLARAVRERLLETNPAKGVKAIKTREAKRPFLTIKEIQALFDTPLSGGELAEDCRRAFLLSCFTGLRLGDLKSLCWGDIQREPEPTISKVVNKTGEVITIPIVPSVWRILNDGELHRRDELVFPALAKTRGEYKPLARWRKAAGIERPFGWHAARHSFAVMSLEASGDIYAVSRLLGHSDIQITTKYLHFMDARRKAILDALPEIDTTGGVKIIQMREAK